MLSSSRSKVHLRLKQQLEESDLDLKALFEFYQSSKQPITNLRTLMAPIQDNIERLMGKDYKCVIVNNEDGTLCQSYPYRLCIPVAVKGCEHCAAHAKRVPTVKQLGEYFSSSSLGRGRGRFVAPVSLVHYCSEKLNEGGQPFHLARFSLRSASLVQGPEVLLNMVTRRRHRLSKSADMTSMVMENVTIEEKPSESRRGRLSRRLGFSSAKVKPPVSPVAEPEPVSLMPVPQPLDADDELHDLTSSSASEIEVIVSEEPMTFEAKEVLMDMKSPTGSPDTDSSNMSRIRKADAKSLRGLGVSYIGDLMVEEKLKLLHVLQAVSSEKADRHSRYGDTRVFCIPYPGYEYFAMCTIESKKLLVKEKDENKHHHHQYLSQAHDKIQFEWEKLSTAKLNVHKVLPTLPEGSFNPDLMDIEWSRYRHWHIDIMTQNYIKLLVSCFAGRDGPALDSPFEGGGVLVHCIMGWDRTPTIVALLRMSLWADGVVNPSLSAEELIYLSIAYDWISFGHDLVYRSRQGVELMYYSFRSLELLLKPEYSFFHALGERSLAQEKNAERQDKIKELLRTFMPIYDECFRLV